MAQRYRAVCCVGADAQPMAGPACRARARVGQTDEQCSSLRGTGVCIVGAGLVPARFSDIGAGRRATAGRPYGGTLVCCVGAGITRPLIGHGRGLAGDRRSPLRGNIGLLRRGGYHPPSCRTSAQVGGRFVNRPYGGGGTVGAGALDSPLVGRERGSVSCTCRRHVRT